MSTAQIKSAFASAFGNAGTCTACTMQYIDDGKMQLLRFYVRIPAKEEQVYEARVPRGESLITAARNLAIAILEAPKGKTDAKKVDDDKPADKAKVKI